MSNVDQKQQNTTGTSRTQIVSENPNLTKGNIDYSSIWRNRDTRTSRISEIAQELRKLPETEALLGLLPDSDLNVMIDSGHIGQTFNNMTSLKAESDWNRAKSLAGATISVGVDGTKTENNYSKDRIWDATGVLSPSKPMLGRLAQTLVRLDVLIDTLKKLDSHQHEAVINKLNKYSNSLKECLKQSLMGLESMGNKDLATEVVNMLNDLGQPQYQVWATGYSIEKALQARENSQAANATQPSEEYEVDWAKVKRFGLGVLTLGTSELGRLVLNRTRSQPQPAAVQSESEPSTPKTHPLVAGLAQTYRDLAVGNKPASERFLKFT